MPDVSRRSSGDPGAARAGVQLGAARAGGSPGAWRRWLRADPGVSFPASADGGAKQ